MAPAGLSTAWTSTFRARAWRDNDLHKFDIKIHGRNTHEIAGVSAELRAHPPVTGACSPPDIPHTFFSNRRAARSSIPDRKRSRAERNKKTGGTNWAPGGYFRCGEISMPFGQNAQAEIGRGMLIVGTKLESFRPKRVKKNRNQEVARTGHFSNTGTTARSFSKDMFQPNPLPDWSRSLPINVMVLPLASLSQRVNFGRSLMHRLLMAACAAAVLVVSGAAQAETVLCPTDVNVTIKPSPKAAGWTYSDATAPMHLDPANPPHVDPTILVCYYVFVTGNNAFDYSQPLNGRTCTTNAGNTGFECHH